MNPLIKRQIRKYFDADMQQNDQVIAFVDAVYKSYVNYEEKLELLQRAITISSEELNEANKKLVQETQEQKTVIDTLKKTNDMLQNISYEQIDAKSGKIKELTGLELAAMIEQQAIKISRIEQQREHILRDLENRNKELRDYAQIVSHDLKSPLRNIMTLIDWIKEDGPEIDASIQSHFAAIEENISKMDNLIHGILEYSIADQKQETKHQIDLNQLISDTINMLHVPDHVDILIMDRMPLINAEKARLCQLFQNLISNAIKAVTKNEEGEIKIGLTESKTFFNFYVEDNGYGIEEKYHEKIFEIFQTLEEDNKSTGIGLSIVKKIIEYYEGKIDLVSIPEKGTKFSFSLKKSKL